MTSLLFTLVEWLAGEFDNQPQAQEQPVWFVPLRLWHRPLPWRVDGQLALFCEQANLLSLDQPYRQRIVILKPTDNPQLLQAEYRAFKQPARYATAGANPEILSSLVLSDLDSLPGCELLITPQPDSFPERFQAEPPPGAKCCFQYNGQTRQVILGFEVSAREFWSFDRGVDPETGQLLWGAMMGPYKFHQRRSFAVELPS